MYSSPVWRPFLKGDIKLLETAQRRYTKRLSGLHDLAYRYRLRALGALSLENKMFHADVYCIQMPSLWFKLYG